MKGQLTIELFFAFTLAILMLMWLNGFSGVVEKNNTAVIRAQVESVTNDVWAVANLAVLRGQEITMELPCVANRDETVPVTYYFYHEDAGAVVPAKLVVKSGGVTVTKQLLFDYLVVDPDPAAEYNAFTVDDCNTKDEYTFLTDSVSGNKIAVTT